MSKEINIKAQTEFGEAVNSGNFSKIDELVSENCVDHDPAPDQIPGPEGYVKFFTMMRTAFPDLKLDVEHLVADDENVSFAYRVMGTHKGDFMGIPASGNSINIRGMQISKFQNGKMVERWGSSDELGILKQIGVSFK